MLSSKGRTDWLVVVSSCLANVAQDKLVSCHVSQSPYADDPLFLVAHLWHARSSRGSDAVSRLVIMLACGCHFKSNGCGCHGVLLLLIAVVVCFVCLSAVVRVWIMDADDQRAQLLVRGRSSSISRLLHLKL